MHLRFFFCCLQKHQRVRLSLSRRGSTEQMSSTNVNYNNVRVVLFCFFIHITVDHVPKDQTSSSSESANSPAVCRIIPPPYTLISQSAIPPHFQIRNVRRNCCSAVCCVRICFRRNLNLISRRPKATSTSPTPPTQSVTTSKPTARETPSKQCSVNTQVRGALFWDMMHCCSGAVAPSVT